jgi:hypothetical protein
MKTNNMSKPQEILKVDANTLRMGKFKNKIDTIRSPGGNRLYKHQFIAKKRLLKNKQKLKKESNTVTVVSQQQDKNQILKDKSKSCQNNSLLTKSSQTLDKELISKERVLKTFWNKLSKEVSKKLWFPTKTDYADLDLISSTGSWFSIQKLQIQKQNLQEILC